MSARIEVEVGAKSVITADLAKAKADLSKFATTGGQSLQAFSKGTNSAAFALTNLGRVAQDAPFGFIGIQNNLNPLLESFSQLKKETGSTGSALKALGSSLMGPAGLGIALSVVSAGILLYQQYQQRAKSATDNAKKATDDYVKSLDQVTQAQLKGAQNAVAELTTLKLLYAQTQNVALSQKQRIAASDELQAKYPAYFKNLSDETILAGGAATKYNELSQAILATARARAAEDLISANTKRQLENEQKLKDLEIDRLKAQKEAIKLAGSIGTGAGLGFGGSQNQSIAAQNTQAESKVNDIISAQNNLKTDTNILNKRNLELVKSINLEIEKGAKLSGTVGSETKGTNAPAFRVGEINRRASFDIKDLRNLDLDDTVKDIKRTEDSFNSLGQTIKNVTFEIPPILDKFTLTVQGILNEGLIASIGGIGEAIGTALAQGNNALEAAGGALLGTLGGVLIQLGQLAIQTGIGISAIKKALSSLNPVIAIAAGVALVALGAFVKGKAANIGGGSSGGDKTTPTRKIPGFATGVKNFSGGLAIVGERGPELVNLPKGSDVIANNKLGSIAGNNTVVVTGDLGIEMGKLVVAFRREEALMGRRG